MNKGTPPQPIGNLHAWALQLVEWLASEEPQEVTANPVLLQHKAGGEKAATDGLVMYDPTLQEPVYSKNGAWYKFDGTLA